MGQVNVTLHQLTSLGVYLKTSDLGLCGPGQCYFTSIDVSRCPSKDLRLGLCEPGQCYFTSIDVSRCLPKDLRLGLCEPGQCYITSTDVSRCPSKDLRLGVCGTGQCYFTSTRRPQTIDWSWFSVRERKDWSWLSVREREARGSNRVNHKRQHLASSHPLPTLCPPYPPPPSHFLPSSA